MNEERATPDDLSAFCCQNSHCPDYGRRGQGNLTISMRYGPHQRRLLRCKSCKARFSERQGTPLCGAQLPPDKVVDVLSHIAEGVGVRQTARLCGVNKNTVLRYCLRAGDHAQQLHDELVAFSPQTREVQFDEKWSFVGKKEKHCDRDDVADDPYGDCWDHVALDPEHRLVVSAVVGERTEDETQRLVEDFRRRTDGRLMNLMTSDENPAYAAAILACYGEEYQPRRKGRRGRRPARRKRPPKGLNYATVHKTRENNRVVAVEQRVVFGTAAAVLAALAVSLVSAAVNTVFVERHNGTDRHRNARKVRKTYCFSKDRGVHEAVSYFTLYSYNFCWPVRTLRQGSRRKGYRQRTPAMAAGLTDHVWTLKEWLSRPAVQRR